MKKLISLLATLALLAPTPALSAPYGSGGGPYNNNSPNAAASISAIPVPVNQGGTGATTVGGALDNLTGAGELGGFGLTRTGTATWVAQPTYKVLGVCSLLDFDPNFVNETSTQQQSTWQNWLLDCQLKGLRMAGANSANLINPGCEVAITSGLQTFFFNHTTPYVIPNYVCPSWQIVEKRQGNSGTPLYNWNGDPTTKQLSRLQQPLIIMPPHTTVPGILRILANSVGTDGGSGWFYGKTWRPGAMQIGDAAGTGFVGGEACTVANPDVSTNSATAPSFTVATASAGGAATLTYAPTQWQSTTGQFYLPAFQRRQQWAVDMYFLGSKAGLACNSCATTTCTSNELSAGKFNDCFDGHDSKHTQVFETPNHFTGNTHTTTTIDGIASTSGFHTGDYVAGPGIPAGATIATVNSTSIVISAAATATATGVALEETGMGYKTTCGGAGAGLVVKLQDWPDWCSGSAADSDSVSCSTNTAGLNGTNAYDGLFGNYSASTGYINQIYEEQSRQNFDSTAGYTWGGIVSAAEFTMGYAQTHLSHYGLVILGSDIVIGHHNDVGSSVQLKLRGGGSIHVMEAREDTPTDSINSDAHALEIDTCKNCAINSATFFHNTNSAADVATLSANYLRLGTETASTASTENADMIIRGSLYSDGSSGGNLTALGCAYTRNSTIDLNVSNIGTSGSARAQQFTLFAAYGSNCENSNRILGSIDNQSGSITSGSFSGAQNVWQAAIQAYVNGFTTTQNKVFQVSGNLAVANDLTNWIIMPAAGSWSKFYAICKTGPVGAAAIFDVQKSTNNGGSFATLWGTHTSSKPTIADGQAAGNTTTIDTATFSAGDVFRVDVDQVGSTTPGGNCTIMGVANY